MAASSPPPSKPPAPKPDYVVAQSGSNVFRVLNFELYAVWGLVCLAHTTPTQNEQHLSL